MSIPELRKFLQNNKKTLPKSQRQIVKKRIRHLKQMKKANSNNNRVQCPPVESPINGLVIGNKYFVNHDIHFVCNPGFDLIGMPSLTCQDTGSWNHPVPTCQKKEEKNQQQFQIAADPCQPNQCKHNGICIPSSRTKFRCKCAKQYSERRELKIKRFINGGNWLDFK